VIFPELIELGSYRCKIVSARSGTVKSIDNKRVNKIARLAGAPHDPKAGIYLHKHKKDVVKRGEALFTIYADSRERLKFAKQFNADFPAYEIG
jgi:thymidine phosphorylase